MLKILDRSQYPALLADYLAQKTQFLIILSVLTQKQNGEIYWDGKTKNFFIVHSFGFCELLELEPHNTFKDIFASVILESKSFLPPKLRWYDVKNKWSQYILQKQYDKIAIVNRLKLQLFSSKISGTKWTEGNITVKKIDKENFEIINRNLPLDLATRFWPSKQDFFNHSFGAVVFFEQNPISVCYACATSNQYAEVDIYTHENFRKFGYASLALDYFLKLSNIYNLKPHWDCYSNNYSSINLAKKFRFVEYYEYLHAVIEK